LTLDAYAAFLESVPDAMLVVGPEGIILAANERVSELLLYAPRELIGKPVECLLPERLRGYHVAHRHAFQANPKPRSMGTGVELLALRRDGREIPVEISLSPIAGSDGLVAAALRDISTRVTVEKALRDAKESAEQASEAKSRFLAAASHDLRQPLQSLRLYMDSLAPAIAQGGHKQVLERMQRSVDSLTGILDSLLDVARLDMGQIRPEIETFPVDDLIESLRHDAESVAESKGIGLRRVPTGCRVTSDRGLLARIVGNLLSNAVHHTDVGRVLVGCRRDRERLRIEVWDTGPGIPAEAQQAIFDEYFQLDNPGRQRSQGLGLGLSIVQRLAALLDHPVRLRSVLGKGTVFTVSVPLAARSSERATRLRPAIKVPARTQQHILYIEDDADVREATQTILSLDGYDVHSAANGEEACRSVTDGALRPDVILSDFRLSGSENGAQVVQRVRTLLGCPVPVVFMTGDTSEARIRETCMEHCSVLRKPVDAEQLVAALNGAVAGTSLKN